MPSPTPSQLHIDRYLTNLSVGFMQADTNFVSPRVFPVVSVDRASNKFPIYSRADAWRDDMKVRPLGGAPSRTKWSKSDGRYSVEERGLEYAVDDRMRSNADPPLAQDERATRLLTGKAAINADRRWAASFFTTGVWSTDLAGVAAAPGAGQFLQFDQAGSDPAGVVKLQASAISGTTGQRVNKIVAGEDVARTLEEHDDVIDRYKHTRPGIITPALLAPVFGVDEFVVGRGIANTAPEGVAPVFERIVGPKDMLLVYAAPEPALDVPSGGYTFAWTGLLPGATNLMGGVIERGRDERGHSDFFQIRTADDHQLVAADLGVFFQDCVA